MFDCQNFSTFAILIILIIREDIHTKNFSILALPELPKPHPPIRATLPTLSGRQKRRFARMVEKNTDDDNNCCHDNFDQNFGNLVAGLECRLAQRVESHLLSNLYQPPNFTMTPSVGQQTIGEKVLELTKLLCQQESNFTLRFPVLSGFQAQADYRGYTSETTEEKPTSKRKR